MGRRTERLLALCAGVLLLCACAFLRHRVRSFKPPFRSEVAAGEPAVPPTVRLLNTVLGSFRSIVVDFLWIRAQDLQDRGQYFAASEIARYVTALQSRVESGWSFQAWNLGVNLTAVLPEEKRWPYVQAALELLCKRALRANPGSLALYYDICWMWLYKIGGDIDPAAPKYREKVRELVTELLGPPPYEPREDAASLELLEELRRQPEVTTLWKDLASLGVERNEERWVSLWRDLARRLPPEAEKLKASLASDPILRLYDRALRARAFERCFGIGLSDFAAAFARYGDFGIGSPESFALAWATRGLSRLKHGAVRYDALSVYRMRFRALRRLFLGGELFLSEKIDQDYREVIALVAPDPYHGTQKERFAEDRRSFLMRACPILFLNGERKQAERLFERLKELCPEISPELTCEDFTFRALVEDLLPQEASRRELLAVLRALARNAAGAALRGDEEEARAYGAFGRDLGEAVRSVFGSALVPSFESLLRAAVSEARRAELKGKQKAESASGAG